MYFLHSVHPHSTHFHLSLHKRLLFLAHQICPLSQSLNHQLTSLCSSIDIPNIIRSCLKMARRIITLRDEDIIIDSTLQWFIEWDRRTHEFLFDPAETFEAGCEFQMMVGGSFGDGGDDGDVVAFRTDGVGGGYYCYVDI